MPNDHHSVIKTFKPGKKLKEDVQQRSKINNDVIIAHAPTNNVSNTTPQELSKEVVENLDKIQKNNPK